MNMNIQRIVACTAMLALSACASIVEGSTDSINVVTSPPARANCSLTNSRGTFTTSTPNPASVKKSISDLNIACSDPATGTSGTSVLASEVEPWDFGNILIGGLIGMGIDWGTGAAYNYPPSAIVTMGVSNAAAAAAPIADPSQPQGFVVAPVATPAPVGVAPSPVYDPRPIQDTVPATSSTIPAQTYYFNPARAGSSGN